MSLPIATRCAVAPDAVFPHLNACPEPTAVADAMPDRRQCAGIAIHCLLLSGLVTAAHAQSPVHDTATTLDGIEVRGTRSTLDRTAAGASRLQVSDRETPASVFQIDRSTLEARGVRSTQEALFAIPGLVVASPPGHGNTVTWRGFSGAQITQLFNGIDVKYASIAARPVDAWIYERVEAIGGPSSFLYGAGAVGGSINYVTRVADFGADSIGGLVSAGAHDSRVLAGGFNQRFGADLGAQALRVDAAYSTRSGWVDAERREGWTVATSLASRLTPTLTHTVALEYQHEDNRRVYWGSPAVIARTGRLDALPGSVGRNYNVADGFYGQDVMWGRSVLAWDGGTSGRVVNTLYHYDALRDYRNVESYRWDAARGGIARSGALQQRHDQQVTGNRTDWHRTGTLAGKTSQWTAGLDLSQNRQTRFPQSIGGEIDLVPIDAHTPGSFLEIPGAMPDHVPGATNRVRTVAMSAENLTRFGPKWSLMTGLRHERIDLDVVNHRAPTATSPARWSHDYAPTTGRIGLSIELTPASTLYVQASTAADPPAGILSTAGFSALRDFDLSRGRQVEAGAKTDFAQGRGTATLAAYRIVREHLAIADPDNPGQTLPVGQQSARGVEATLEVRPWQALQVQANAGWVDARLDDFFETAAGVPVSRAGNRPANTPSRVGNLWIDYAFSPRWSIGTDLRAVASRYADNANTLETAGYALWGAHLRWQAAPQLAVTLRGRNLADRTYVLHAISTQMVYLGEPRSVDLELRAMF
ncbi:TonB-dependent receptor [Luteimonas terrae]|uniref:Iron complex outermembrane receptor protein n=1 Tax=Luteimonas terrae TaxID=1530191 RepID=A0ABU1XT59_9GAMM|nr:TonB-dependent receptor [Luteimonas terrae]MDR7191942.1 iron complex outermembrane receptor protein [Luteimonas terrae]